MDEKKKQAPIELRSEKMRQIIGDIPSGVIYWGTTIIVVIFLILFIVLLYLPYPYGKGESILEHLIN